MSHTEQSILQTLAYFSSFHRPLTAEELYRYLWRPTAGISFFVMVKELEQMKSRGIVGYRDGYYFLPGKDTVPEHQAAVWLVEKKMKIAVRAARKMRYVPFIRAVFVCNTVAMGSPREESDVDVFIVVSAGRLWFTRLLVTIFLSLFGIRRSHAHVADHVCLSFYHTDKSLSLEPLRIAGDDIYLVYWISQLMPLYDQSNLLSRIQKENAWVLTYAPNAFEQYRSPRPLVPVGSTSDRWFRGRFGDWCERMSKKIQVWKMARNRSSVQHEPDTRVVVSDTMLKFHENDRRAMYREQWLRVCEELQLKD